MDEGGRGLLLVGAYAAEWGHRRCADGGKVVWARIEWPKRAAGRSDRGSAAVGRPAGEIAGRSQVYGSRRDEGP